MIKFSHTIFALPFALSAVVMAQRTHPVTLTAFFWILVAMVGARSAAMGFNRIVDAEIDGKNPRTAMREIPSGALTRGSAVIFTLLFSALFILAAGMLGPLPLVLSVPVLLVLFSYSYTKRFTWLCHLYLGFTISLAPMGAWVALTNSFSWPVAFLSLGLLTYIAGFDILYACQDTDFDIKEGLHSIPSRLGVKTALTLSSLLHVATFGFFLLVHMSFGLNRVYLTMLGLIAILLVIEHRLINPRDLSKINIAFFHINSVISVLLFVGILASEIARPWI